MPSGEVICLIRFSHSPAPGEWPFPPKESATARPQSRTVSVQSPAVSGSPDSALFAFLSRKKQSLAVSPASRTRFDGSGYPRHRGHGPTGLRIGRSRDRFVHVIAEVTEPPAPVPASFKAQRVAPYGVRQRWFWLPLSNTRPETGACGPTKPPNWKAAAKNRIAAALHRAASPSGAPLACLGRVLLRPAAHPSSTSAPQCEFGCH